jgi:hypothetical protein
MEGGGVDNFAAWLERQPASPIDQVVTKLERHLIELSLLDATVDVSTFERRLHEAVVGGQRSDLLLDVLVLEVGVALTRARRRVVLLEELDLVRRDMITAGSADPRDNLSPSQMDEAALELEIANLRKRLVEQQEARAAAARRAAVLQSLASLGYEVGATMETAWVKDRRLVVRSATRPDYGVEIGGDLSSRIQLRAVAFVREDGGPDPRQDRDAETIWCSHVGKLQSDFAANGGRLEIETALRVGETPLKRLSVPQSDHEGAVGRRETKRPQSRTI